MTVPYVAVVGAGNASPAHRAVARAIGSGLAARGAIVVCGGLGGVMEAVCEGATEAGGVSIGVLPGTDRTDANRWATFTLPTGLGEARNALVARAADVVIAVGGEYGTLSEIALALRAGTPVVGIDTWQLAHPGSGDDPVVRVVTPGEAVERALQLARGAGG